MNIHILPDPKWSQQRFVQRLAGERIAQIRFPEFLVFQKLLSSLKGMVFAHNKKQEPPNPSSSPPPICFGKIFTKQPPPSPWFRRHARHLAIAFCLGLGCSRPTAQPQRRFRRAGSAGGGSGGAGHERSDGLQRVGDVVRADWTSAVGEGGDRRGLSLTPQLKWWWTLPKCYLFGTCIYPCLWYLGGGNSTIFHVHPYTWGKMNPIWRIFFEKGWNQQLVKWWLTWPKCFLNLFRDDEDLGWKNKGWNLTIFLEGGSQKWLPYFREI